MVSRQMFSPDRSCLVITTQALFGRTLEHSCVQIGRIDLEHIHDILPCKINGLLFEIVAERPVTQHLEHGVVVGIVTYFLQVVVLTAHAQTFLTVRYTRVLDRVIP